MRHPSQSDLSAFIDGACDHDAARRIHTHLDTCSQCFETYRDAVRMLGTANPDELSTLPRRVIDRALGVGGVSTARARPRGALRSPRLLAATATGVVVLMAGLLWQVPDRNFEPFSLELAPITESLASYQGKLVFPDTEGLSSGMPTTYRSSNAVEADGVHEALRRLLGRFRRGETSHDETYWLAAGYASLGDGGMAREVMALCRSRSNFDFRFEAIEAILAYRANDLEMARTKLQAAIDVSPRSAVAHYDLAMVLRELGQEERAQRHLHLARRLPGGSSLLEAEESRR